MSNIENEEIQRLKNELAKVKLELKQQKKYAAIGRKMRSIFHDMLSAMSRIMSKGRGINRYLDTFKLNIKQAQDFIDSETYADLIVDPQTNREIINEISLRLKSINNEGKYIIQMLNQVVDYTREDNNKVESFLLNPLIKECLNSSYEKHNNKNIQLEGNIQLLVNCPSNLKISSDKVKVKRILYNLIDNGLFAIYEKNNLTSNENFIPEINIEVTEEEEQQIKIDIKDNGIGISENIKNQIFTPSFTTKNYQYNSGLGLSIVKNTLEEIGGKILIESIQYKYTKITITIPQTFIDEKNTNN